MCSFRAGNFDFIAIATHARWGKSVEGRRAELQLLADWIDAHFKEKFAEDHDLVVMGDFNTPAIGDDLFNALTSRGLQIPDVLQNIKFGDQVVGGTNLKKDARYDQILHLPSLKKRFSNVGGTLDFFDGKAFIDELFPGKNYDSVKFSFQISDHFPVWVQIKTDIDGERLDQIVQNNKKNECRARSRYFAGMKRETAISIRDNRQPVEKLPKPI